MEGKLLDFIKQNSPDGGFLQSDHWRKFQESVGRKTYLLSLEDDSNLIAHASIIKHTLPIVGSYFYAPRGPIFKDQRSKIKDQNDISKLKGFSNDLIEIAKENNIGWIRIEPASEEMLEIIKNNLRSGIKLKKSSVDMQPREILMLDISKSEEELIAQMKQKTRYNIRLAEKRGVRVFSVNSEQESVNNKYFEEFLGLVKITAERDKITLHPENYYRKMFEIIPNDILKLYAAEYEGKVIAANLVLFFGQTATYLHGASDNVHRDAMAPYLLQWKAIKDAKNLGCTKYDLGGIKMEKISNFKFQISNSWSGITRFKTGFRPNVEPIRFPGCYDIILNSKKYFLYKFLQRIKRIF